MTSRETVRPRQDSNLSPECAHNACVLCDSRLKRRQLGETMADRFGQIQTAAYVSLPTFLPTKRGTDMARLTDKRKRDLRIALELWLRERGDAFGTIEQLPSGRLRARYAVDAGRFSAPTTYDNLTDARAWLEEQRKAVLGGYWVDPRRVESDARHASTSLNELFAMYMAEGDLKPRTRDLYTSQWRRLIEPTVGAKSVVALTPLEVVEWRNSLPPAPRQREQANDLLRAVLNLAIEHGRITTNPAVTTRRKTAARRTRRRDPERTFRLTRQQVAALADAMQPKYRFAVLFSAGTGVRIGELGALRRSDLTIIRDEEGRIIRARVRVERAVTQAKGEDGKLRTFEGTPKTDAGIRTIALPSRLHDELEAHLSEHAMPGSDGLLFTSPNGDYLTLSAIYGEKPGLKRHGRGRKPTPTKGRGWWRARVEAGVPKARWHLLRHTAISEAVDAGARPADLLARFGHTDLSTSAIYQHSATEADDNLADRL